MALLTQNAAASSPRGSPVATIAAQLLWLSALSFWDRWPAAFCPAVIRGSRAPLAAKFQVELSQRGHDRGHRPSTLTVRGVSLVVLDQGIDTTTAVGRMFFQILGATAGSSTP